LPFLSRDIPGKCIQLQFIVITALTYHSAKHRKDSSTIQPAGGWAALAGDGFDSELAGLLAWPFGKLRPMYLAALIFDCDGTLADSMPAHYQAWAQTFRLHGIEFSEKRFYQLAGLPTDRIAAIIAAEHGVTLDPAAVARQKDQQFLTCVDRVKPFEPVVSIARDHRGILPMAVASGSARELVERELAHLGVLDWFNVVLCAEDVTAPKPAPDIFLTAAQRLGMEPYRCIVYEDSDLGIQGAIAAGMQFVDVRRMR
jgi:beta-phosphoglucomutase-like phosphatase (HAD superfamily)